MARWAVTVNIPDINHIYLNWESAIKKGKKKKNGKRELCHFVFLFLCHFLSGGPFSDKHPILTSTFKKDIHIFIIHTHTYSYTETGRERERERDGAGWSENWGGRGLLGM